MEKKLKLLFDYQKFQKNERLAELIEETDLSPQKLTEDQLTLVSAAGNPYLQEPGPGLFDENTDE